MSGIHYRVILSFCADLLKVPHKHTYSLVYHAASRTLIIVCLTLVRHGVRHWSDGCLTPFGRLRHSVRRYV